MFYQMITAKRNKWLTSPECTVKNLLGYIKAIGQMRDAQIEALQTYLFLKIGCDCKPLSELFCQGEFNTLELDEIELKTSTKEFLKAHPAAAALFEYSRLKDDAGNQLSVKLEEQIKSAPESIDYEKFFKDMFYGVSYTDYLFSLPMGAGKTYLMAAFIYLDLYFANQEPQNPAFAHNFIIFAPSGLKSSVVPSLRTIQKFDPSWVIPEPAASELKRQLIFEVLDQNKTAKKSNKTKNPNVQKIASHQPLDEAFGLVAVTNAEKVIYDRLEEEDMQLTLFKAEEQAQIRQSRELREIIGKISHLSVFIDEVHHASSAGDSKLRKVVDKWTESRAMNCVIGFSGTPYLGKAEKVEVTGQLSVATAEITNTVYYYPLVDGVGNFLKFPMVKIADVADSSRIIEAGVREFLNTYKNTVYQDGTVAKLGIYCASIEKLEERVYPLVTRIIGEYGISANCILKFHKGNKQYPQPADSQMQFDTLDKPISKIRIILLVQVGKEGWDCRSLTGIILSQEGDCNKNMVLQTSCRCLRQVDRGQPESAIIYLNSTNGDKLITQLQQQHHLSLKEFEEGGNHTGVTLNRYNRTAYLKLPKVDFYQLKVNFETVTEEPAHPERGITKAAEKISGSVITSTDFSLQNMVHTVDDEEHGEELAVFSQWLYGLARSSFGLLSMEQVETYSSALHTVFEAITYEKDGTRYFSSHYDRKQVEANIRKAFCDKRTYRTKTEHITEEASLLNIANFSPEIRKRDADDYYPAQEVVERIILDDKGQLKPDKNTLQMMQLAEQAGQTQVLELLRKQTTSHPQKDRSFHYLPYKTDSNFEQIFLKEVLPLPEIEQLGLEVYYNGDRAMTEFKIKCYKSTDHGWVYVGMYTPDFLIIQRKNSKIHKALIVETKGKIYANDPTFKDKRAFVESEFLRQNNATFGYKRFEYLYLENTIPEGEQILKTHEKICEFFRETSNEIVQET